MSVSKATNRLALSEARIGQYRHQGYLIVRRLFSEADVQEALEEADRLIQKRDLIATENLRCRWQPHVQTQECLFECFDPVIDISPVCERLARDARLLQVLGDLYGEEACLFKDKLIFKPPGAKGYDLHQDFISWRDFPRSFVTALIALDGTDLDNGCTTVYPGYHHNGYLSPEDGDYHSLPRETVDEANAVPLILEPGDVAIFGCFTPHCSAPNRSQRWRRQLYLSYNAFSDGGQRRDKHYQEFHEWLRQKYAEYGKQLQYYRLRHHSGLVEHADLQSDRAWRAFADPGTAGIPAFPFSRTILRHPRRTQWQVRRPRIQAQRDSRRRDRLVSFRFQFQPIRPGARWRPS